MKHDYYKSTKKFTPVLFVLAIFILMGSTFHSEEQPNNSSFTGSRMEDSLELVKLYNSTNGSIWLESWNLEEPMDNWFGVILNEEGRVYDLGLVNNRLFGPLPDLNLPYLTNLGLNENKLNGTIPDFSGLPNLETLWMHTNELTGPVPDFSNLPKLRYLVLTGNQLNGTLPDFSNLPALHVLNLYGNQISGPIPDFSNLPILRDLILTHNQLNGPIPDFSNLTSLKRLEIATNPLNDTVIDFSNLPELEYLTMDNAQLRGPIPDFSNMPKIQFLGLGGNLLEGSIPDFSNLRELRCLYLGNSNLEGQVPDFSNLPRLNLIALGGNRLNGEIPDFSNLPQLVTLDIVNNQFTGEIPDFSHLENLEALNLGGNNLSGTIPDFTNLNRLSFLNLDRNDLKDSIPNFSNLPRMKTLILNGNNLTFCPRFTNMPVLEVFNATANQLTFSDVLRNIDWINDYQYGFQKNAPYPCPTAKEAIGSNLGIQLYFDDHITENQYQWYKNDVPYLTVFGQNRLDFNNLQAEDAGYYRCEVTNPNAPELVLHTENILLQINPGLASNNLNLNISNASGGLNDQVCFDIKAQSVSFVSKLDLSMQWDPNILAFNNVTNLSLADLDAGDFGLSTSNTNNGKLTIDWDSENNPEGISFPEETLIYQVCFTVKVDTCLNSTLSFTDAPQFINVTNTNSDCIFLETRPGIFSASCQQAFRIADQSNYQANTEYTDPEGWTNYIKVSDAEPGVDTLLLSIQKNGQSIGSVGDGVFEASIRKDTGSFDLTEFLRQFSGFEQIEAARLLNYFWEVNPNYTAITPGGPFGLRFYFSQTDLDVLAGALETEASPSNIIFFKAPGALWNQPLDGLLNLSNDQIQLFTLGDSPSLNTWAVENFGENEIIGNMLIESFSYGGMIAFKSAPTQVEEISSLEELLLTPNPSDGFIQLSFTAQSSETLSLNIVNQLGSVIHQKKLNIVLGKNNHPLQLETLTPGIYFLQLQNEQGQMTARKFVITK